MDSTDIMDMTDATKHSMTLFMQACGGQGPLQLNVESIERPEAFYRLLNQPFALIGRDPRSDLVLGHPQVNLRHAYMQRIAGRMFCVDLGSKGGTHWESGPQDAAWLEYDRAVRIGPYRVRPVEVRPQQPGEDAAGANRPGTSAISMKDYPEVTLEFVIQNQPASTWPMLPLLAMVGKAHECRVRLMGPSVSAFHCSLVRTPFGVWAVDLFGRGGIWVNDVLVRCSRLDDGDRLQVGNFMIRLHYDTSPAAIRPELLAPPKPPPQKTPETVILGSPVLPSPTEILSAEIVEAMDSAQSTPPPAATESNPSPAPAAGEPPESLPAAPTFALPVPAEAAALPMLLPESALVPIARQLGLMQQQMFDQFQQAMMMMFQMFNTLHRDQVGVIRQELEHLHQLNEEVRKLQADLVARTAPPRRPAAPPPPPARKPAPAPVERRANPDPVPAAPRVENQATVPTMTLSGNEEDVDMHAWLSQRILTIQQERQTHWQKIVNFLTGKPSDGGTP